ncbi:uberolysin/carnocyclin family circular bacteriocin [Bacillus sp. 28A-2]|uniref:uberolysin/carnocyclin family circular bacteriocin n=1 Tax=Bacillus sp. 28A-2 TaxID=2772252 RepID=UPI00168D6E5E|nr:uberolysin/carnocyclin family circular bacteriocin [Bacillus sp. 28A-2]MBD3861456.1 uberolysin/carnocyclin family circular bacteriocin [Bacillus sp. 28A-2]
MKTVIIVCITMSLGIISLFAIATFLMGSSEGIASLASIDFNSGNQFALDLATNLGISRKTAYAAIGVIMTTGDVLTILSLLAVVLGGTGLVTAAMVATAKKLATKHGKKYAAEW